jgi:hypothetical protein
MVFGLFNIKQGNIHLDMNIGLAIKLSRDIFDSWMIRVSFDIEAWDNFFIALLGFGVISTE